MVVQRRVTCAQQMMNAWSQVKPSRLQSRRNQAVRSRLSVEALRLYDGLGVLVPARVDETSGYRYHDDARATAAEDGGARRRDVHHLLG
ncbi:MAG: hypothetical protein WAL04_13835 [Acidimicrobiales bacterium]